MDDKILGWKFACMHHRHADFMVDSNKSNADNPDSLVDYSEEGVDLTLIRWMVSLTPAERLSFLEERINEILAIRELNTTH